MYTRMVSSAVIPLEIKKSEEIVYEMEQSFKLGCLHAKPGERMW